jgi:hypothetical protein
MRKHVSLSAPVLAKDGDGNPIPLEGDGEPEFETHTKTWDCWEANLTMGVARTSLVRNAPSDVGADTQEGATLLSLFMIYCPLAACSTGDVPTFEEFVNEMHENDANRWYEIVRGLNPHWYVQEPVDVEEAEEHRKKK